MSGADSVTELLLPVLCYLPGDGTGIMMNKKSITTYEEAVAYLYDIPRFTKKNTLEDTRAYLHRLGDPDQKMHIIHVAGTNGKGSVCTYMRGILEAAGKKVAIFTSPHLVDIRERIVVCGQMVDKQTFLDAFLQIYESLDWQEAERIEGTEAAEQTPAYHPTYFEYLFFIAMIIFAQHELDYVILETGLGGRLDATNAVGHKEISVITRISLEHVEYLGHTISAIAGEKAGIMQAGAPVVFTDAEADATAVFVERASELGTEAVSVSNKDYAFLDFKNKSIDFSVYTRYYGYIRVTLHTVARYQMENAALAVRAIEVLDRERMISESAIAEGLSNCFWAGRMEEVLPGVYVDGAHNEDGIRAFLESVREDGARSFRTLLFSVVGDKDYKPMIRQLVESGLFEQVAIAHMESGRAASLESMRQVFDGYESCKYHIYTKVDTALREMLASQKENERIYIVGSLYLVGEIKELLEHDQF